jgi:hypothetical protein
MRAVVAKQAGRGQVWCIGRIDGSMARAEDDPALPSNVNRWIPAWLSSLGNVWWCEGAEMLLDNFKDRMCRDEIYIISSRRQSSRVLAPLLHPRCLSASALLIECQLWCGRNNHSRLLQYPNRSRPLDPDPELYRIEDLYSCFPFVSHGSDRPCRTYYQSLLLDSQDGRFRSRFEHCQSRIRSVHQSTTQVHTRDLYFSLSIYM